MVSFKKSFSGPSHIQLSVREMEDEDYDELNYVTNIMGTRIMLLYKIPLAVSVCGSVYFAFRLKRMNQSFYKNHLFIYQGTNYK